MIPGVPPCVIFEDEHLLVVHKPAGWNTHAPAPHAGEGIYDWLRHREARWASLAIVHRLDKETSGVMVFGKSPLANRSLTAQFTERDVHKRYLLLTNRPVPAGEVRVETGIVRAGERYVASNRADAQHAVTIFRRVRETPRGWLVEAEPLTGRTHQIRVHAAERGFPILGDTLYGGAAAERLCLHAADLGFEHPQAGTGLMSFRAEAEFAGGARFGIREACIEPAQTNAFRLIHGAADGWPGWYVDRLGDYVLSQSELVADSAQRERLEQLRRETGARGAYHKVLRRQVRKTSLAEASPEFVAGEAAPERFELLENGLRFEMSFGEGYSTGLFLDQRDNRRRWITGHVAADWELSLAGREVLNAFAYTCGFSVAAARGGARVTSLDLSRKYLDWGRRNFALNGLDAAAHDFIYGDVFDWLKRLGKKGRKFDAVILDPPTFSQAGKGEVFRAEKDYGRLLVSALGVLNRGGVVLASTNAARLEPAEFVAELGAASRSAGRKLVRNFYVPQPPDFPITRAEPGYLKTVWLQFD
jgi:23S rRNA (cytosine1962-C5)-methyltransferase